MLEMPRFEVLDSQEKLKSHFKYISKTGTWVSGISSSQVDETAARIVEWTPGSRNNIFMVKSQDSRHRDATAFLILSKLISDGKRVLVPTLNEGIVDEQGLFGNRDVLFLNAAESRNNQDMGWEEQSRLLGEIWSGKANAKLLNIPILTVSGLEEEDPGERKLSLDLPGHKAPAKRIWQFTLAAGFFLFAAEFFLMAISNGIRGGLGLTGSGYLGAYPNPLMNFLVYGYVRTSPYDSINIYPFFTIFGIALILISRRFVDRRTYRFFINGTVLWIIGGIAVTLLFNFIFFGPFSSNLFSRTTPALIYEVGVNSCMTFFFSLAYALFIVRFASSKEKILLTFVSAGYVAATIFQSTLLGMFGPGTVIRPGYAIMPTVLQILIFLLLTVVFLGYFFLFLRSGQNPGRNRAADDRIAT